jgi:hypothetical protein
MTLKTVLAVATTKSQGRNKNRGPEQRDAWEHGRLRKNTDAVYDVSKVLVK